MIAFNESERTKAFGSYTGCPCTIALNGTVTSTDKSLTLEDFKRIVDNLISQWHSSCDRYEPGPTLGERITENWDKEKKLRYGRVARIPCIFNETAPRGAHYCKLSLKDIGR
jgi:hypothetical protein